MTKPFTLPGLLPSLRRSQPNVSVNAANGRRVQIYLPPPPPPTVNVEEPKKQHVVRSSRFRPLFPVAAPGVRRSKIPAFHAQNAQREASKFTAGGYPSPGPSRSSPSLSSPVRLSATQAHAQGPRCPSPPTPEPRVKVDNDVDCDPFAYRPPSPPASDPVLPPLDEGQNVNMQINVPKMRKNATWTRSYLAKVFHRFFCDRF